MSRSIGLQRCPSDRAALSHSALFPFDFNQTGIARLNPTSPHPSFTSSRLLRFSESRFRRAAADLISSTALHSFILPEQQETRACRGRGGDVNEKLRRVPAAWHVEPTTRDAYQASGNRIWKRVLLAGVPGTPTAAVCWSPALRKQDN